MSPVSFTITALAEGGFIVTPSTPFRGDIGWPSAAFAELDPALTFVRDKLDEAARKARSASGQDTAAATVQRAMT